MGFKKNLFFAGAFAACAFAAPLPDCTEDVESGTGGLTAATLVTIAPKTKSCEGGSFPDECADATRAAAALNKAFETYKITSKGEQAAIVAYELFESGDFKFNKNHFPAPGRPGQGTRMMAMPPFIEKYATAVAGADAVQQAKAKGGDAGLAAVLDLVNSDDEKSFGSAAWFVTTQCNADVRAGLAAGTEDGWTKFLVDCVGTTADPARNPAWVAATANIK